MADPSDLTDAPTSAELFVAEIFNIPIIGPLYRRAKTLPSNTKRFVKFAFVGIFGFIIDFTTFTILTKVIGIEKVIAQAMSFTVATTSNFLWNYFWIYPEARGASILKKVAQFTAVSVASLIIRTPIFAGILYLGEQTLAGLGVEEQLRNTLDGYIALGGSVFIVMLWNFFVNRYWTYREVK